MRILFLYPEIPDTFWSFKHALKFVSKKAAFPPLGLLTVATMMPDTWEKRLVDMNVRRLRDPDILWADYVCISAMHVQKESVNKVVARCKALGARIIAGGPYFTTSPDLFDEVDHLVLGEGELVLPELVSDLTSGTARRVYAPMPGPDLALTPIPQWDLITLSDYDSMLVQFSRGCPFDCEFCDIVILNGRRQRTKSPGRFLGEIESLYRSGWRGSVFVVDDNFIGAKARVKEMLRELRVWMDSHGRPFHFLTEASINLAEDQELMTLMADAGFNKVFVGIETPNAESLEESNKQQNLKKDLLQAVRTIQKNGMEVMAGFILGFDHDPDTIFENQIDFIQSSGITMAMVGLLTALPGTKLWKRLSTEGRLIGDSSGNNTALSINFIPKMDMVKLVEGYRRVVETIYSPEGYYRRCVTFLKGYRQKTVSKVDCSGIVALIKSAWSMGIRNDEGFRPWFWKLLIRSLMINPRTFGEAVRLMIVGIHFRKSLCTAVGEIPFDISSWNGSRELEPPPPPHPAVGQEGDGQKTSQG